MTPEKSWKQVYRGLRRGLLAMGPCTMISQAVSQVRMVHRFITQLLQHGACVVCKTSV
jgi:hypothetical protein